MDVIILFIIILYLEWIMSWNFINRLYNLIQTKNMIEINKQTIESTTKNYLFLVSFKLNEILQYFKLYNFIWIFIYENHCKKFWLKKVLFRTENSDKGCKNERLNRFRNTKPSNKRNNKISAYFKYYNFVLFNPDSWTNMDLFSVKILISSQV